MGIWSDSCGTRCSRNHRDVPNRQVRVTKGKLCIFGSARQVLLDNISPDRRDAWAQIYSDLQVAISGCAGNYHTVPVTPVGWRSVGRFGTAKKISRTTA